MIARYTRIKRSRGKRRVSVLRDKKYRYFLHDKPCAGCGYPESEAAHTENNGLSSKGPDSSCGPLCHVCHREYDAGREEFERKRGIDMKAVAAGWYRVYLMKTGKKVA